MGNNKQMYSNESLTINHKDGSSSPECSVVQEVVTAIIELLPEERCQINCNRNIQLRRRETISNTKRPPIDLDAIEVCNPLNNYNEESLKRQINITRTLLQLNEDNNNNIGNNDDLTKNKRQQPTNVINVNSKILNPQFENPRKKNLEKHKQEYILNDKTSSYKKKSRNAPKRQLCKRSKRCIKTKNRERYKKITTAIDDIRRTSEAVLLLHSNNVKTMLEIIQEPVNPSLCKQRDVLIRLNDILENYFKKKRGNKI